VPRHLWAQTPLATVATGMQHVPVAAPDEPLADLLPRLEGPAGGRALVLESGRLVGIVSPLDITRAVERSAFRGTSGGPRAAAPGDAELLGPRT
jgi:CBS-domain-containing membrane protein